MKIESNHILFFADNINKNQILFDESDSRHIISSLRLSEGAVLNVTDGLGAIYSVKIATIQKKRVIGAVLEQILDQDNSKKLRLFVGMPEKDSFERLIPMVVPQGVSEVIPIVCEYCQKKWWEKKWEKDSERFLRVLITSAKQSWNANFPIIQKPINFSDAVENVETLLYADIDGINSNSLSTMLKDKKTDEVNCFVGPPGGFSPDEISKLSVLGTGVHLGNFRLRTELAASLFLARVGGIKRVSIF